MNEPQKISRFALIVRIFSVTFGVIVVCWLSFTIIFTVLPYINQSDYSYVGNNFAEALRQNNSRLAHRLSVPSQWERIDEWIEKHESLECPFSWDPDAYMSGSVAGASGEDLAHVAYFEICFVRQNYEFKIDEIVLQRQNNRWLVVDWSEVQETKDN